MPTVEHQHSAAGSPHQHSYSRSASRQSLAIAFVLTASYLAAEVVVGVIANSLALLADAGHMVTDAAALGLALFAMWLAARPTSFKRTFGFHRTEILAAFLNALSLWIIAAFVFLEAYRRFLDTPEVQGTTVLLVGGVGLLINVVAAGVLHRASGESLNIEGAFLHVVGDLLGSVGVMVSGALIVAFGWAIVDPISAAVIGLIILLTSGRLLWKVTHVLLEGTPTHLDLQLLCQQLEQVKGVTGVHDIHAWSITSGYEAFSAHITVDRSCLDQPEAVLQQLRDIATRDFGISHVTIQLDESTEGCTEAHHTEHPATPLDKGAGRAAGSVNTKAT